MYYNMYYKSMICIWIYYWLCKPVLPVFDSFPLKALHLVELSYRVILPNLQQFLIILGIISVNVIILYFWLSRKKLLQKLYLTAFSNCLYFDISCTRFKICHIQEVTSTNQFMIINHWYMVESMICTVLRYALQGNTPLKKMFRYVLAVRVKICWKNK